MDTPGGQVLKRCGRYELLERIGFGGMAEVYKARLPGPEGFAKIVVIKRILPRLSEEKLVERMFIEEAKIAAAAHHNNIAQVFELGRAEDGQYYMAMEYISGLDLEALLGNAAQKNLRLPVWFSVSAIIEVLEALSFVHSLVDEDGRPRNVIHRDATPSNIFISDLGQVKLSDFGVADYEGKSRTTQAGQLKGKLAYMSPEQLNGRPLDQRSDLFSIGIVLWELLTQQRLFGKLNELQAMMAICEGHRPAPSELAPGIPERLDRCVLKTLSIDRDARHHSAASLQAELLEIQHQLRPSIRPSDMKEILEYASGKKALTKDLYFPADTQPPPKASSFAQKAPIETKRPSSGNPRIHTSDRYNYDELRDQDTSKEGQLFYQEGVFSAPDPAKLEDTHIPSASSLVADIGEYETVDEFASAKLANEVSEIRRILAEGENQSVLAADTLPPTSPMDQDPTEPLLEDSVEMPDPTIPMEQIVFDTVPPEPIVSKVPETPFIDPSEAPRTPGPTSHLNVPVSAPANTPPPKVGSQRPQRQDTPQNYQFWVRARKENPSRPLSLQEALGMLQEGSYDGKTMRISVDNEGWYGVSDFAQLTGIDVAMIAPEGPSNVTVMGSFNERSLVSALARIARDSSSGILTVARTQPTTGEWYELVVHNGLPTQVATNVHSMQLPSLMVGTGALQPEQVPELIHSALRTRLPLESHAKDRGLPCPNREDYLKERLLELMRWDYADYTFDVDHRGVSSGASFATSLLSLMPPLLSSARPAESLLNSLALGPQRILEPSWRFGDAEREFQCGHEARSILALFSQRVHLDQLLQTHAAWRAQIILWAYMLSEADFIIAS